MSQILQRVNIDLIIPIGIMILFTRSRLFRSLLNSSYFGLRLFISSDETVYARKKQSPQNSLEKKVFEALNNTKLTLIEIDKSVQMGHMLSKLEYFEYYNTLLLLGITSFLSQLLSQIGHCIYSNLPLSSWNVVFYSLTLSWAARCNSYVLFSSTAKKFEFQFCLFAGVLSLLLSLVPIMSSRYDFLGLSLQSELHLASTYFLQFLPLLSNPPVDPDLQQFTFFISCVTTFMIGFISTGLAYAGLKTGQIISSILSKSTIKSFPFIIYLWIAIDNILLLSVALFLSPWGEDFLRKLINTVMILYFPNQFLTCDVTIDKSMTCKENSLFLNDHDNYTSTTSHITLFTQVMIGLAYISTRLVCVHTYLQTYLYIVYKEGFSMLSIITNVTDENKLHVTFKAKAVILTARSKLGIVGCLLIAPVVIVLSGIALLIRLSPSGIGMCSYILSMPSIQINRKEIYQNMITEWLSYNATLSVINSAIPPTLSDAVYQFLMTTGQQGRPPSDDILLWFQRIFKLKLLPTDLSTAFVKKSMAIYCLLLFMFSLISIIIYTIRNYYDNTEEVMISPSSETKNFDKID